MFFLKTTVHREIFNYYWQRKVRDMSEYYYLPSDEERSEYSVVPIHETLQVCPALCKTPVKLGKYLKNLKRTKY